MLLRSRAPCTSCRSGTDRPRQPTASRCLPTRQPGGSTTWTSRRCPPRAPGLEPRSDATGRRWNRCSRVGSFPLRRRHARHRRLLDEARRGRSPAARHWTCRCGPLDRPRFRHADPRDARHGPAGRRRPPHRRLGQRPRPLQRRDPPGRDLGSRSQYVRGARRPEGHVLLRARNACGRTRPHPGRKEVVSVLGGRSRLRRTQGHLDLRSDGADIRYRARRERRTLVPDTDHAGERRRLDGRRSQGGHDGGGEHGVLGSSIRGVEADIAGAPDVVVLGPTPTCSCSPTDACSTGRPCVRQRVARHRRLALRLAERHDRRRAGSAPEGHARSVRVRTPAPGTGSARPHHRGRQH